MDPEFLRFLGTAALGLAVLVVVRRVGLARKAEGGKTLAPAPAPIATPAPAPTLGAAGQLALERVASQAVLLRREVPPRAGTLSFWGGVPVVPPGFEWPCFTPEGSGPRALSFLLQVDCAELPAEAGLGLMPSRGVLYFFMDLDWGVHWQWRVLYSDADPRTFAPAAVPASLPRAYGQRDVWEWPRNDDEWPRLLPRFTVAPTLVRGPALPPFREEDEDDRFVWPGSVDLEAFLREGDGLVIDSPEEPGEAYGGALRRPYPSFPQDWQAVRIVLGHLPGYAGRAALDRMASRVGKDGEAGAMRAAVEAGVAAWGARADSVPSHTALSPAEREEFWSFLEEVRPVSQLILRRAAEQSLDATLGGGGDALLRDAEAMAIASRRHALATNGPHGLHLQVGNRMLSAPTDVQGEAAELAREWLMLLELSSDPSIGHHLAEGVVQFLIRPEDLAQRRFDRVNLVATAY